MKKIILSLFLLFSLPIYAGEIIPDFSENSLVILNERLRKIEDMLLQVKGSSSDGTPGYLSSKVDDTYIEIDTNENITVKEITATKINVDSLSAISADLGTITAGSITGTTIQTASGNPKIVLDPDGMTAADSGGNLVFQIETTGGDVGDVTIGQYDSSKGAQWDESEEAFNVKGVITATSGNIGGWTINANSLSSANNQVILNNDTNNVIVGDTNSTYIDIQGSTPRIKSSNFVSGALGTGWQIGTDLAEFQNIYARGKISTSVFEKDTISVIGGNLLVMGGDVLTSSMTAVNMSTMVTAGDETFATGDTLRIKDGVDDEWMSVLGTEGGANTYIVRRDRGSDYQDTDNVLLLHFDGIDTATTTFDSSNGAHSITFTDNAQLDTTNYKFGNSSLLLDGISDSITMLDSVDWNYGTGDFTIDFWMRTDGALANFYLFNQGTGGDEIRLSYTAASSRLYFTVDESSSNLVQFYISPGFSADTLHHVELVRDGTTSSDWYLFIDGVNKTKTLVSGGYNITMPDLAASFVIGGTGDYFKGWYDEFRVSKGIARHTANFTPSTEAYTTEPLWAKGTSVVNFGASGEGGIYMTSSETNNPYISVVTHAGSPWSALTTRARLGNLNGYLGYSSDKYGIAIGETNKYLKYDPTNGLRIAGILNLQAGSEIEGLDATNVAGWAHGSDTTKIDGGDIYTNTVTATQINVSQLDAIAANVGTLTVDESISSSDYVADTSGFKLDATAGLEINEGKIYGAAIKSGTTFMVGFRGRSGNTWSLPVDTILATKVMCPYPMKVSRIVFFNNSSVTSCNIRMGIYNDNGSGYPGSLLVAGTELTTLEAYGENYVTIAETELSAGVYWIGFITSTSGMSTGSLSGTGRAEWGVTKGLSYTTLPDPFTAAGTLNVYLAWGAF